MQSASTPAVPLPAPRLMPTFWMDHTADAAIDFYLEAFAEAGIEARSTGRLTYPDPLPWYRPEFAGATRVAFLDIAGTTIGLINAADENAPGPAMSLMLNFDPSVIDDAEGSLRRLWARLIDGGQALMDLDAYPWSGLYGWVEDRFGLHFQLMLTKPEGDPRPFTLPALTFAGTSLGKARDAVDHYLGAFPDSSLGQRVTDPERPERVIFSDFCVGQEWIVAMDGMEVNDFTFTAGGSFHIHAPSQAERDYYLGALSHVPEAEVNGWCRDRYGVTWRITEEGGD
ncbi:VOC family protein [Actinomyces timonensis]|uniref:VOC family protein n=1 Tax=Actinomyces timonensis TaxID=1288391 RepID=UPI00030DF0EE|nr:VOC family protein [Actinomyces timonensis]